MAASLKPSQAGQVVWSSVSLIMPGIWEEQKEVGDGSLGFRTHIAVCQIHIGLSL